MKLINGKLISKNIYSELCAKIRFLKDIDIIPGLAVILVGDRVDSNTYVRMKEKKCQQLGIYSEVVKFNDTVKETEIVNKITDLNNDNSIHGILIQLPLPKHINENNVLSKVSLNKDVDGFHCSNIGNLTLNKQPTFIPCTPKGCIELLKRSEIDIEGKHAVILGRSNIVGLPLSLLLLHENATVSICHSRTKDIKNITQTADILIAACGRMEMVKSDWIKEGCVIIDVGINSKNDATRKRGYRLVGDVDFEDVKDKVGHITPVPGGVGPMTIAMLMSQTVESAVNYSNRL
jgi:5,10-methylene-tetrahydrofolate dehydrogenase/methenyl tetrahydrofolate cyclohydrolase